VQELAAQKLMCAGVQTFFTYDPTTSIMQEDYDYIMTPEDYIIDILMSRDDDIWRGEYYKAEEKCLNSIFNEFEESSEFEAEVIEAVLCVAQDLCNTFDEA
jgi:hypothetical protein